ncbi:protein AKNAD1 [Stigmatopora nigra]
MDPSEDKSLHLSDLSTKTNKLPNENLLNQKNEQSAQNTSDEDQEDLPYDHHLESPYINPNRRQTATNEHPTLHHPISDASLAEIGDKRENKMDKRSTIDMNQMLLRHFSQEELLQSGQLIEAETLPEVSLLESSDDFHCNTSTNDDSAPSSGISQRLAVETCYGDGESLSKSELLKEDGTPSGGDVTNVKAPTKCEEHKVSHLRSRSFSEFKYGQGQVHYPLPDFSKVAPKVKIPKGPNHPVLLLPQVPNPIIRAQSSPGMLEVISKVLEDSDLHSSAKKTHEQTSPTLVCNLKAEYDKVLAKNVQAENLIDKMRLGTNVSSEFCIEADPGNSIEGSHIESAPPVIPTLGNIDEKEDPNDQNKMKINEEDDVSEAEKMAAELRAVIGQFMQSVDEFKQNVNNMSVSIEEQQMILRSLMETQDQLERKYMSKKEEHRALEMQNYLGLCRNIGIFDPNRLVEGDIFRVGMQLEDIKEMIDKNRCEQINWPLLSEEIMTKLHGESSASWTTECFRRETMIVAQKENEGDVDQNDGLEERSQNRSDDSMQVSNGTDSSNTASFSERRRQVDGRPIVDKRVIRKQESQGQLL